MSIDMNEMQTKISEYMQTAMAKVGEDNLKKGEAFLAENAKKEGVQTLEGGVQYKVLQEGTGAKPLAEDKVKVHYVGTVISGEEFDSSVKRGEPAEFYLNQVIKGWTMALQEMTVGSKWIIYIPSDLGYGTRGAGGLIGPNEVLIFEVELLEIVKEEQQ
jgi:FKBP-type peptidyl-prolyl cis-trans isomerase FklB